MKVTMVSLLLCIMSEFLTARQTGARYLIITHDDYYDAISSLANWKTQKGLKAKIVRLSEIGSDSIQIRNYIVNAYNTWEIKPEYLLLVGDKYQLPFPQRLGVQMCHTDNYYTNVIGDFHNEIIPGRFWVSDTLEAKTVVAKVMSYENDPYIEDSLWFGRGVTIINLDYDTLPGDSNYYNVTRVVHGLMKDAGFNLIDSLIGLIASSNFLSHDSLDVINAINNGCSYVTYRGGAFQHWCPPFGDIYPAQMNNGYKLPIVVSATCATIEGIGFQWLRAGTPEQPKGVVGFFGTTTALISASAERSALMHGTITSIFRDSTSTLGKAAEVGRIQYFQLCGDSLEYDGWTCLGDPEMTVRTGTPRTVQVTHPLVLWTGVCTCQVAVQHNSLPVESALVCLMARSDTSIYHYGHTNNAGLIEFIDTITAAGDSVLVTVTGRNARPYCGIMRVAYVGAPYVLLNSFFLNDSSGGNGDLVANPGEDIEIPVWLKNWGDTTAYSVSATLHKIMPDTNITLSDTIKYFGDIPSFDSADIADGFNVFIAANCPDLHDVELQLIMTDDHGSSWTSPLSFTVHAPAILLENYYFPGYLRCTVAGDTDQLIFAVRNSGTYIGENVEGRLFCSDSFVTVIDSLSSFGSILPDSLGSNQTNPFVITSDPQTPLLYPATLHLEITSGVSVDTFDCVIYVGPKDYYIWDPDPNHSSGPVIQEKLDELNYIGEYSISFPYGFVSNYKSLFVCCGVYPNNIIITDTNSCVQEIEYYVTNQGRKVYLEGGDVWCTDPPQYGGHNFCPLFSIEAWGSNVGPVSHITGCTGTFTESMLFRYQGEGTALDWFDSTGGSSLIFKSTYNNRGIGVAANHKTVGVSFEFGALVDTIWPSTKNILMDSIMHYFAITPTGISEGKRMEPESMPFLTIHPNPCPGIMYIEYGLGQYAASDISLKVFDVTGRLIKEFLAEPSTASHPLWAQWDGSDDRARKLSSGVYFIRLEAGSFEEIAKVVLLRQR